MAPRLLLHWSMAADEFVLVKLAVGGRGSEVENSDAVTVGATQNADRGKSSRGDLCHSSNATDSRSPYEAFRSYGTLLAHVAPSPLNTLQYLRATLANTHMYTLHSISSAPSAVSVGDGEVDTPSLV